MRALPIIWKRIVGTSAPPALSDEQRPLPAFSVISSVEDGDEGAATRVARDFGDAVRIYA